MNKQQIKTICEADDKLEWWAMVLFAEFSELVETIEHGGYDPKEMWSLIKGKAAEFPRLVVRRAEEKATEQAGKDAEAAGRLAALEGKVLELEAKFNELDDRVVLLED